jgi:hypothetical protein
MGYFVHCGANLVGLVLFAGLIVFLEPVFFID